jgi:uncharacterized protein (DUF4415 family)
MRKARRNLRSVSLAELREMEKRGELWATPDDAPTFPPPKGFWKRARPLVPAKKPVNLRVDEDVLDWFRAQGKGHLTRMNAVLRSYYEAHRPAAPKRRATAKGSARKSAAR